MEQTPHNPVGQRQRHYGIRREIPAKSLDFPLEGLAGKLVLDVGYGMGRFAEIVLKYGGIVVGADLSYAVDA